MNRSTMALAIAALALSAGGIMIAAVASPAHAAPVTGSIHCRTFGDWRGCREWNGHSWDAVSLTQIRP